MSKDEKRYYILAFMLITEVNEVEAMTYEEAADEVRHLEALNVANDFKYEIVEKEEEE